MDITFSQKGTIHYIQLKGELDITSSIRLDDAIASCIRKDHRYIAVDFSDLTYISSAGLGVFVSYVDRIKEEKIKLGLFNMTHEVKEVFKILGLHKVLDIYEKEEHLMAGFNG